MYKKVFSQRLKDKDNTYLIHLWTDEEYSKVEWINKAYIECDKKEATHKGLNGEPLKKVSKWYKDNPGLHFHDMPAHQKFLIEKYGIDDTPSETHRILFFDIENDMLETINEETIKEAAKKITSIALWDKQLDWETCFILDPKSQLKHTKTQTKDRNREIHPCKTEEELLARFLEKWREIDPDIIISWNGDYYDVPYLYYRICRVLGEEWARYLSPIGYVRETPWARNSYIQIVGVESLDYMRMHKKYIWYDEPSWKLDYIGEKYVKVKKIEYEGNLNRLYETDIFKFVQYNFRDVEILRLLDDKFQYIALTIRLSHKGKHNYSEVYAATKTHDGAISSHLLNVGIVPPSKDKDLLTRKYAGGFLFCPKAGVYNYMFDEDLQSQYPAVIISLNIGKETLVGRIIDIDRRNNRLALNDLKNKDPEEELLIENAQLKRTKIKVKDLIQFVETNNWTISANGVFFRTDRESILATVLKMWWDERVEYQNEMKEAYNNNDYILGASLHLIQYTYKILLNSLYGATALASFRYGNVILSEAITLTGQRLIQESALIVNRNMNQVIKGKVKLW